LVEEAPGAVGRFVFAHDLIREALYARLSTIERVRLHRSVGEAIERTYGDAPEHLDELAHHFAQSAPAGDASKALDYAIRAAQHAMRVLAYEQAAELYELALSISELLEADPEQGVKLLVGIGRARTRADDPAGRDTLLAAAEAAREVGRPELLAEAALGVRAFALSPGVVDAALADLLQEALDLLPPGDSVLRARLLARLALTIFYRPSSGERREALVEEALAMARRLGDRATLAYVLTNAQLATWAPDTAERGLAWVDEVLPLAEAVGDVELALTVRNRQIDLLLQLDDLPGADVVIEALERLAARHPDPRARAYVPLQRARRALIEGRYSDAERLNSEAAEVAASLRDPTISMFATAQAFGIRASQGRLRELETATRRVADSAPAMPAWRVGLARVYCELHREAEARREFERLARRDFADIQRVDTWLLAISLLGEVCSYLGDSDRAGKLYELLAPHADQNVVSMHAIYAGPVSRYLGLLATTRSDWETASGHFAAAARASLQQGARPALARIRMDEAAMLASRQQPGDRERALQVAAEASRILEDIGADTMLERAKELRRRIGAGESAPQAPRVVEGTAPSRASLRHEGEAWAFDYEGRAVHVRDTKGVRYLATLIANPGLEIHAIDLVGGPGRGTESARTAADAGLDVRATGAGDIGPALDPGAKDAYRRRLEELREELEEAEAWADPERATRAREEMDFLAQELASAVGLGGRDRKQGSTAERARVNVTRAIRSALKRIAELDTGLGRELEATVRTGTFCAYEPDPRHPMVWRVDR
jgi:hypothetical protein